VTAAGKPAAGAFLKWLSGSQAKAIFERHGF
jgi:ABC-type molybdate transport system substrate-binding protein